jgi:hypothetical protein
VKKKWFTVVSEDDNESIHVDHVRALTPGDAVEKVDCKRRELYGIYITAIAVFRGRLQDQIA